MEIKIAQNNFKSRLADEINAIKCKVPAAISGDAYSNACFYYRGIAVFEYLLAINKLKFRKNLLCSAKLKLELLERPDKKNISNINVCTSKNTPFIDAIVAQEYDLAIKIAKLSPDYLCSEVEYEEDFLFYLFLYSMLYKLLKVDSLLNSKEILARWEKINNDDPYFAVCLALENRDIEAFNEALFNLVDIRNADFERWAKDPECDQEMLASQQYIFMSGIALVNLAKLNKMNILVSIDTIPAELINKN